MPPVGYYPQRISPIMGHHILNLRNEEVVTSGHKSDVGIGG